MKKFLGFALLLVLGTISASAEKISQTLHVPEDVSVGTAKLVKGDYKMVAEGAGATMVVTLSRDGKQFVKVNAQVTEAKHDFVSVTVAEQNGKSVLETIELKTKTLVLEQPVQ